jgi:hypothetical protein
MPRQGRDRITWGDRDVRDREYTYFLALIHLHHQPNTRSNFSKHQTHSHSNDKCSRVCLSRQGKNRNMRFSRDVTKYIHDTNNITASLDFIPHIKYLLYLPPSKWYTSYRSRSRIYAYRLDEASICLSWTGPYAALLIHNSRNHDRTSAGSRPRTWVTTSSPDRPRSTGSQSPTSAKPETRLTWNPRVARGRRHRLDFCRRSLPHTYHRNSRVHLKDTSHGIKNSWQLPYHGDERHQLYYSLQVDRITGEL